jgi:hypothetical protein
VGIMRELIRDGENGLFCGWETDRIVPPLVRLLEDAQLAERISRASPGSVAHLEYHQVIRDYAQAYVQAAKTRATGRTLDRAGVGRL